MLYANGLDEGEGVCMPVPERMNNGKIVYSAEPANGKYRWNTTARVECDEDYVPAVSRFNLYEEVTCELYDEVSRTFIWMPPATAVVNCKPRKLRGPMGFHV